MSVCFLLLGTNLGDKQTNLQDALDSISVQVGSVITKSSIYSTAAWGKEDQSDFLNQIIKVDTELDADQVLEHCLAIEKELGRIRFEKWGERLIDIDILYFDDLVIDKPDLKVPHPEIQNRRFTLVPMVELAKDLVHPKLNRSQTDLLSQCPDLLEVNKL
ncbi:MAG: 2-amino-4-hydroxy-6-hydroxymethyldihydropteridine diphosphokinase [Reichenbachiella sp.]